MGLLAFGPAGWGDELLAGAAMTLLLAVAAYATALLAGGLAAAAALSNRAALRGTADLYSTVLRGVPPLLVVWALFFGGGRALTWLAGGLGVAEPVEPGPFATGALAVGLVGGAYAGEALRGGMLAVPRGQIEAARALGMPWPVVLHRIWLPQALRHALPGLANVWQMTLKDTALVSVTALTELLRSASVAGAASHRFLLFYALAAGLYLSLSLASEALFRQAERRAWRGIGA
jgi:octopine/nopaline transport system permease protein